jgi:hypothetical protein
MFHVSQLKKHIGIKAIPEQNLPLVTSDGYIKTDLIVVLDTRALLRRNEFVTQWKIHWQNLFGDQTTWEDKSFIRGTFLEFYFKTLKQWWPLSDPSGQASSQVGGSCHNPVEATTGVEP